MEMRKLKREFGRRLSFHGAVENQRILPFGTPAELLAALRFLSGATTEILAYGSKAAARVLIPCAK